MIIFDPFCAICRYTAEEEADKQQSTIVSYARRDTRHLFFDSSLPVLHSCPLLRLALLAPFVQLIDRVPADMAVVLMLIGSFRRPSKQKCG